VKLIFNLFAALLFFNSSNFCQNQSSQFVQLTTELKLYEISACNRFTVAERDNILSHHHSFFNLSGQALVGSALAFGFAILPLSAGALNAWSGKSTDASQTAFGILALSSYLFGATVGVHWIAKSENPNLSFWATAGYSAIGGGVGIIVASVLAANYTTVPTVGVIIIALTPIIGSMIYASFISDWPNENQESTFSKINFSHKDLIEQTNIINLELLRIKL
jgi:hypothetical protein